MTSPLILYVAETVDGVRAKIVGFAALGRLKISNWIAGSVGQQILETVAQTVQAATTIIAPAIRGFASLDTSVDPGDPDPYDPANASLPWSRGFLSDLGEGTYGTPRGQETYATGALNFANTGPGAVVQTIPASPTLTFQSTVANAAGLFPTYRNANPTPLTVGVGVTISLPVVAEVSGSSYNAAGGQVTVQVNALPGVTVTNPDAIIGQDLQGADDYRAACREAASLTSPNGPADSYRYLAVTGRDDGTWGNSTTGNSIGITGIYVSQDSSTGIVTVYYKGPAGGGGLAAALPNASGPFTAGSTTPVQAANYLITQTPGVIAVADAITFSGQAATDVTINIVASVAVPGSAIGASAGTYTYPGTNPAAVTKVFLAWVATFESFFASSPIGGFDQTAGAGTIYQDDLRGLLYKIQVTPGINLPTHHGVINTPSGPTAIALGHDAVLGTVTLTLVVQ